MRFENTIDFLIKSRYASLRDSEKKVADYVLAHEGECRTLSLEMLAKKCGVSQPTVIRFVKALGYPGFRQFRYRMIEEAAERFKQEEPDIGAMYGYYLEKSIELEQIPSRIVATTVSMLENMLKSIAPEDFRKAIQMLAGARRICLYCVENSAATARDLLTKLLYLGMDCRYDEDYYIQQITAAALTPEDVAVGISYSGQSRDVVDVMKVAKKAGAQTIAVTNFKNSLIGKWSDVMLCSSQEQLLYGDAIFSRATQIVIVDMLYMGLIAGDYERCTGELDKNSRIIRDKAYR
jgi:DNA-binding MurR/RpiR family transcriptional regulator